MKVYYDDRYDLLYIRFSDERKSKVRNVEVFDGIVLDVGENGKIVGIEIVDASQKIALENLLPVKYTIGRKLKLTKEA